ncbi:MAG: hypothetical protein ACQZ3N_05900 [cyanobacterium endosymbiont of Rhopalodia yunnanensis]
MDSLLRLEITVIGYKIRYKFRILTKKFMTLSKLKLLINSCNIVIPRTLPVLEF